MAPPHWTRRNKQKHTLWQLEQTSAFTANPLTHEDVRCRATGRARDRRLPACCSPPPTTLTSMLTEPVAHSRFRHSSPLNSNLPELIHSSPASNILSLNSNYDFAATDTLTSTSLTRDPSHTYQESPPEMLVREGSRDRSPNRGVLSESASNCWSLVRMRAAGAGGRSGPALQVANRLIRHARHNKTLNESSLRCLSCNRIPVQPVTGSCGHTRCTRCTKERDTCPCGTPAPDDLHVNTLIQELIRKFIPSSSSSRAISNLSPWSVKRGVVSQPSAAPAPAPPESWRRSRWQGGGRVLRRECRRSTVYPSCASTAADSLQSVMSSKSRVESGRKLVSSRRHRHRAAAAQLARLAATSAPLARLARASLVQTISVLSEGQDPRQVTRDLYRLVRQQAASNWLKPSELECVLCYHPFTRPVTTPCGHTYCRTCIERSMDYRKTCALCLRGLDDFNLATTRDTVFVCAALASIDALTTPLPPDPDIIPIFVCTVAYPAIPCPLLIFDPRYWLMIRRVLESGSRRFGMVACARGRSYSDHGTVLEVRDCVHLEDGRSILSTVGVSRFKVIERDVFDGCDVARIQPLTDIAPTEDFLIWDLRVMAAQVSYKALLWLNGMNRAVRAEIESAFGRLPRFDPRGDWWGSPDGPAWLWWLIAILPLRSEIKVLILSTKSLLKRMMAVARTLEAIDQIAMSSASSECNALQSAFTHADWADTDPPS